MARKREAAAHLLAGFSPSQIATRMGITTSSVVQYLMNQIGEGQIRRTDILFSIPREIRRAVEESIREGRSSRVAAVQQRLERRGMVVDRDDLSVYLQLRHARAELGDLYELLREIELCLHSMIRKTMIQEHGEAGWWRNGIPADIRSDCAATRERDERPADDPFCYTTLIQIRTIFDKKWGVLLKSLPQKLSKHKQVFLSQLSQVNTIRNAVMHPCKGIPITDEDFLTVREFHSALTSKPQLRRTYFSTTMSSLVN